MNTTYLNIIEKLLKYDQAKICVHQVILDIISENERSKTPDVCLGKTFIKHISDGGESDHKALELITLHKISKILWDNFHAYSVVRESQYLVDIDEDSLIKGCRINDMKKSCVFSTIAKLFPDYVIIDSQGKEGNIILKLEKKA